MSAWRVSQTRGPMWSLIAPRLHGLVGGTRAEQPQQTRPKAPEGIENTSPKRSARAACTWTGEHEHTPTVIRREGFRPAEESEEEGEEADEEPWGDSRVRMSQLTADLKEEEVRRRLGVTDRRAGRKGAGTAARARARRDATSRNMMESWQGSPLHL